MTPHTARVFLIGAGPGDPGLITVRGLGLLRSAEVVLYDRLVHPALVDEAPADAERIFVGKKPGGPSMPQAAIDALIVEHARAGRRVVRLKGGDPFVFGRGADEAQALVAAGISFEIVPGITSALAVSAYAGIPVTHSGAASSFAVLTAHESSPRPDGAARWADVVRGAGTLVFLMGVGRLEETMQRAIEAGRDPDEPAAVIERGTLREQRTIVATVATVADAAAAAGVGAPAITVVGPVVRLRDALSWVESKPLFGRRIVVTRSQVDSRELREQLTALGADAVSMPLIATEALEDTSALDAALSEGAHAWVAFASRNAVEAVLDRAGALGVALKARVAAVGEATAQALARRGTPPDVIADEPTGRGLARALGSPDGRVLVPTSEGRSSRAADELESRGWDVISAPAYRTVAQAPGPWQSALIETGDHDAIVFASGSAAEAFAAVFDPAEVGLTPAAEAGPRIVAIGPSTASALTELGLRVDAVAEDPSPHGLTHTLLDLLAR